MGAAMSDYEYQRDRANRLHAKVERLTRERDNTHAALIEAHRQRGAEINLRIAAERDHIAERERLTRERDEAIRERDDARAKLELTRKLAYDMLDYVRETGWQRVSVWQQRMTEIWGAGE